MDLSKLTPAKGSTKNKKRVGRGQGSGKGGHTAGKGHKGQKSRSGASIPAWFEGGQMPLQRRIPKFGFKNRFRTEYKPVNLGTLQQFADEGAFDASQPVTPEVIVALGLAKKKDLVKVLGGGELTSALNVSAHAFSASAKTKLEAAGGSATTL